MTVDLEALEALAVGDEPECTPWGRVAALDRDTYLTLREIGEALANGAADMADTASELGEQLSRLHDKTQAAYEAVVALRWGW